MACTASFSSVLQVFELQDNKLQKIQEIEKPARFKCGTFGASSMSERQLATGSFQGQLQVTSLPTYTKHLRGVVTTIVVCIP